jgi:hypothetical protein
MYPKIRDKKWKRRIVMHASWGQRLMADHQQILGQSLL